MKKNTFRPQIFSTDQYKITLPEGHKFPVLKYGMLRQIVEKEGLFQLEQSALADAETVSLAHDPGYYPKPDTDVKEKNGAHELTDQIISSPM